MVKFKNISSQLKKYTEEIALSLIIIGLSLALYFIGCGTTQFNYVPPGSCADLEIQGLDDPKCDTGTFIADPIFCEDNSDDLSCLCEENPDHEDCTEDRDPKVSDDPYIRFSNSYVMGKIDIIFVVDNSSSMYEEQQNIAGQFDRFLDSIDHLDYRIAMMTVDTSDSPGNEDRYYQDGKFIRMGRDRIHYLENEDFAEDYDYDQEDNVEMFKEAIQREESLECLDDSDQCPDDERAICALNLSFDRSSQADFFRPTGHLMVIILSDEDERSSKEYIDAQKRLRDKDYSLTACDDPYTFYRNVSQKISKHKSVSVHSIIIPPGDRKCLRAQESEHGHGYEGEVYKIFSEPSRKTRDKYPFVLEGQVISICDKNYGRQLGRLSDFIADIQPIALPCIPHKVEHVKLKKSSRSSSRIDYRVEGRNIIIEEDDVPLNSKISVSILCSKDSKWHRE